MTRWLDRLFLLFAWVSGGLAALMMATTFVDVVLRYLFSRTLFGAFEVTEIAMGLIVFTALPLAVRQRENIVVTLLTDRLPSPLRRVAAAVTDVIGAAVCLFVAWRLWLYGERLLRYGEVTLELRVPKGAIACSMAAMLALAALAFLLAAWRVLREEEPPPASALEREGL